MKKLVIFVHGEVYPEFIREGYLHKKCERLSGQKIIWHLVSGYLNSQSDDFLILLKNLENADIFICDSDNTNLEGEIEKYNFEEICFNDLINALVKIKEHKPDLKIFIKNLSYVSREQTKQLANYGTIIESWLDRKIITDLK